MLGKTIFVILILASTSFTCVMAQSQCLDLFRTPSNLGELNPIEQLLEWEQIDNLAGMRKPSHALSVSAAHIPEMFVEQEWLSDAPKAVQFFNTAEFIVWPQHPNNTESSVPFYDEPVSTHFPAYYSASRSLFMMLENELYSIKVPTNRPHPLSEAQPTKAHLEKALIVAVTRSQHIKEVDERLGLSENVQVLYNVASYMDKNSKNGFILRDLRPLQDGNYYLPGFSIPYVGKELIEKTGGVQKFKEYWGGHYATAVGRAKAEFLLRYGLQMNSPNTQNILVQLDKNFLPTGKIFLRDIEDARFYETVAHNLGFSEQARQENAKNAPLSQLLNVNTSTSFWKMDEAGIPLSTISAWEKLHDQAFVRAIIDELGLDSTKYQTLIDIQNFFSTDGGARTLQKYGERQGHHPSSRNF